MGSIDDALAGLQDPDRACLRHVVACAREVRPEAVDGVSYGVPALLLEGKPLLGVAAAAQHLALYPFSPAVLDAVAPALEGFSRSRGTIRFTADRTLPDDAVREIVRLRGIEITGPRGSARSRRGPSRFGAHSPGPMATGRGKADHGCMAWARLGVSALAAILLTACATPGNPGGTPGDAPRAVDPAGASAADAPAADGEVIGQGTVLQGGDAPPEFCLGGVMESWPPQCSGPPILDWDWELAGGFESAAGVTWGAYAVTGTWDGSAFTRTGVPVPLSLYDAMPFDDPLAGRQGATAPHDLERIQREVYPDPEGSALTAGIDRGFVVVTVVYDDGTVQARMDARYGADVVVVRSALRPHG